MIKFLNPVKYFQDKKLLTLNLVIFCIGTFIAITFLARFDGVLDLHFLKQSRPIVTMTDNIINIVVLSLILFGVGKIINTKTRMIDCLNTVFYSRIPFYLLSLTNIGGFMSHFSDQLLNSIHLNSLDLSTEQYIYLAGIACISLFALALNLAILFNGFKVATNAKNMKQYLWFVFAIILAEIISSVILKNL